VNYFFFGGGGGGGNFDFTFWNFAKTNHHFTRKGEHYRFAVLLFAQFFK
jgi:hypothetical protein